jgi:OFA family oxalate/formate antiporter-like MFS transporter
MNRWFRLVAAVIAMMMIANLQYSWTLFVKPIIAAKHWKLSDVQWAFTLYIAFQTWVMPCTGFLVDRLGPRLFLTVAGVICGIGWVGLGYADSLTMLYVLYSMAGFGAALVYCGSTGVGLKWFADRRGLAAGLVAAGYGSGSALFVPFVVSLIKNYDYKTAFLYTGVFQATLIIIAAQFLRNPAPGEAAVAKAGPVKTRRGGKDFNSAQMLRTPHFYLMFMMAVMMGIGGLMTTAQVAPMAATFGIGAATVATALVVNPLANGGGRIFWGWVSDHLGREQTMTIAFLIQAVALIGVTQVGNSPALFILAVALVYFTWGEVYSLFPSATADFFGAKNASSNYAFVYSAKGVAAIAGGGLAALLFEKTGSWSYGFYGCAVLALIAAAGSVVLRKMPLPRYEVAVGAPGMATQASTVRG